MMVAPAGTCTLAAGPTASMRPSRSSTVWPGRAVVPVPSMSSTSVMATTGALDAHVARGDPGVELGELGVEGARREHEGQEQGARVIGAP